MIDHRAPARRKKCNAQLGRCLGMQPENSNRPADPSSSFLHPASAPLHPPPSIRTSLHSRLYLSPIPTQTIHLGFDSSVLRSFGRTPSKNITFIYTSKASHGSIKKTKQQHEGLQQRQRSHRLHGPFHRFGIGDHLHDLPGRCDYVFRRCGL